MISSTFQIIFHLTGPTKDRRIPLLDGHKPFDAEKMVCSMRTIQLCLMDKEHKDFSRCQTKLIVSDLCLGPDGWVDGGPVMQARSRPV